MNNFKEVIGFSCQPSSDGIHWPVVEVTVVILVFWNIWKLIPGLWSVHIDKRTVETEGRQERENSGVSDRDQLQWILVPSVPGLWGVLSSSLHWWAQDQTEARGHGAGDQVEEALVVRRVGPAPDQRGQGAGLVPQEMCSGSCYHGATATLLRY